MYYADRVKKEYPEYDVRVSILGHLQRGGAPSANDRILASRLGEAAIQALMEDQQNVMIGIRNNEIVYVPFAQAIKNDKPIDKSLIRVCPYKVINSPLLGKTLREADIPDCIIIGKLQSFIRYG